jgi:hypothetical protein
MSMSKLFKAFSQIVIWQITTIMLFILSLKMMVWVKEAGSRWEFDFMCYLILIATIYWSAYLHYKMVYKYIKDIRSKV